MQSIPQVAKLHLFKGKMTLLKDNWKHLITLYPTAIAKIEADDYI